MVTSGVPGRRITMLDADFDKSLMHIILHSISIEAMSINRQSEMPVTALVNQA